MKTEWTITHYPYIVSYYNFIIVPLLLMVSTELAVDYSKKPWIVFTYATIISSTYTPYCSIEPSAHMLFLYTALYHTLTLHSKSYTMVKMPLMASN